MIDPANMSRDLILNLRVTASMIDLNDHLSDVSYHRLFSQAEGIFHKKIEIDDEYIASTRCTVYTVESHITFLKEILDGDSISISFQLLDLSNKAAHVIMAMRNSEGTACAFHECMFLHVKKWPEGPKPHPFGRYQLANLVQIFSKDKELPRPARAGKLIGIRRKTAGERDVGDTLSASEATGDV